MFSAKKIREIRENAFSPWGSTYLAYLVYFALPRRFVFTTNRTNKHEFSLVKSGGELRFVVKTIREDTRDTPETSDR